VTFWDPLWDNTLTQSAFENRVLYSGYGLDPETGLYHVRARYYHPDLGRWAQRDPAGYVDSPNLYQYVLSNPLIGVDPTGEFCLIEALVAVVILGVLSAVIAPMLSRPLRVAAAYRRTRRRSTYRPSRKPGTCTSR